MFIVGEVSPSRNRLTNEGLPLLSAVLYSLEIKETLTQTCVGTSNPLLNKNNHMFLQSRSNEFPSNNNYALVKVFKVKYVHPIQNVPTLFLSSVQNAINVLPRDYRLERQKG